MKIPLYSRPLPYLTTTQMIEVDRTMIEDYKIELIQMMENAGHMLAHLARVRFLAGNLRGKQIVVLAGTGGNGGGALVCARRLHNYGADVRVFTSKSDEELTAVPCHQLAILRQMQVPIATTKTLPQNTVPDLIIDGIIGYSLKGAPRDTAGKMIRWANRQGTSILALDVPSGVNATTGTIFDPAIHATATMTLALPKEGLHVPAVKPLVGELYLADISVPPELYAAPPLGLNVGPIFAESDIVQLW